MTSEIKTGMEGRNNTLAYAIPVECLAITREPRKIKADPGQLASGVESDGITYSVTLDAPCWVAVASSPDGRTLTEKWRWAFEPKMGADLADYEKAEQVLEKLVSQLRNGVPEEL